VAASHSWIHSIRNLDGIFSYMIRPGPGLSPLPLFTKVDEHPQAAIESKRISKHLKRFFKIGPRSSQSSSPQPYVSTSGGDISSALVSSGVQLINPSLSTLQQDRLLTDKLLSSTYRSSYTNLVVAVVATWIWIAST